MPMHPGENFAAAVFEDWPTLISDLISILEQNAKVVANNDNNEEDLSYLIDGPLQVIELLLADCGTAVAHSNSNKECDKLFGALMFFAGNGKYSNSTRNRALKGLKILYDYQPNCVKENVQQFCKV